MQQIKTKKPSQLENNMQFETFDFGSTGIFLSDKIKDKAIEDIDDLGLKGQKDLIKNQGGKVIPYPKMTIVENRVWEAYCPNKTKLEDYSQSIIPFEVIDLIRIIKKKGFFDINEVGTKTKRTGHIEIWSEATDDIDPLLIGVICTKTKYNFGWSVGDNEYYLIARWGRSLKEFEDIKRLVAVKLKEERTAKLKASIDEHQRDLASVENDINEHLNGRFMKSIW